MTKYRQTFTIEGDTDRPVDTCINPGAPEFLQAGSNDSVSSGTTISWTAPEPIIEVPTGIGAVVVLDLDRYVRAAPGDPDDDRLWVSQRGNWAADDHILDLLKAGAEIKSYGVEL